MAFRWGRVFAHAARRACTGAPSKVAVAGVAAAGLVVSGRPSWPDTALRLETHLTVEQRLKALESQIHLMTKDQEERRAIDILVQKAKQLGLDIHGGTVRRTSSRFCFGVEHGDYNGTELFGVGTDRFIWLAFKPNKSGKIRLYSDNYPDEGILEFVPGKVPAPRSSDLDGHAWARYAWGVDHTIREEGLIPKDACVGFDAVLVGNIPGGGMSRSASLIINLLLTMLDVNDASLPEEDFRAVDLSHKVETSYVGTPCGKLDQIMIYFAKDGNGTRYDPATGKVSYVPLGLKADEFRIAALDTGTVRHGLEKSTYAIRVKECQELVKLLKDKGYKVNSLADVKDTALYERIAKDIGQTHPNHLKRLEYIHFSQKRFDSLVEAWADGDIAKVGSVFRQDGIGLRDSYQISGPELETMCDVVRTVPGVLGERMLGGGDKGASGAILLPTAEEHLRAAVNQGYKISHPAYADKCAVHVVKVCQGVEVFEGLV